MHQIVNDFFEYRKVLIENLQDEQGECFGCSELKWGYYKDQQTISDLSFSSSFPCNCKCIYCGLWQVKHTDETKHWLQTFRFDKLMKELIVNSHMDKDCSISISAGEITVNPRCDEILDLVKPYRVILFSNCIKYSKKVEEVIQKSGSFLLESIDAGTRETYAQIKGVDCYDTVVSNIMEYSRAGCNIELKYIVLPMNIDNRNLEGFIQLCNKVKPQRVRISCDIKSDFTNLPEEIVNFSIRLGKRLIEAGHEVLVLDHFGDANNAFIKSSILGE